MFRAAAARMAAGSGEGGRQALPRRGCCKRAAAAPWSRPASFGRCVRLARYEPISVISSVMASPAMDRPGNYSMLPEMTRMAAPLRSAAKATGIISGLSSRLMTLASCQSLRSFTRELMDQASRDLGTGSTGSPSTIGTRSTRISISSCAAAPTMAQDLVISRDYIATGLRARASDLVTRELGPRSELEVRRGLEAEVTTERWTRLDRVLAREAGAADGVIDLRPDRNAAGDPLREIRIGRMRTLAACPEADLIRCLPGALLPLGP